MRSWGKFGMPEVNHEILWWARDKAGMSVSEAAQAIGLRDGKRATAEEQLRALESGEKPISRPRLLKMAEKYHRSLLVFYLDQPPRTGDRGEDFRTAPNTIPVEHDAILDALLRNINVRHNLVRSLLEDEEAPNLNFIGSASMDQGAEGVSRSIVRTIGFDLREFRNQEGFNKAFNYLRNQVETAGVFLLLIGNLGSHHTNISAQKFRGFAIADRLAPFIVINDQDAQAAWSFTALHEVAHLWLGATGVSAGQSEAGIERFCDDIAGRVLLKAREIGELTETRRLPLKERIVRITEFASERNISRTMTAYNLWTSGLIPRAGWEELRDHFFQAWIDKQADRRERQRERQRDDKQTGPSYYVVRRHRLGRALLSLVGHSLADGSISHTKAAHVLGVKPRNVEPLLRGGA